MPTILIEKNVMVPMRDGVQLATDIYRLEGAPPTPVLVVRIPYN
jgi:predicted acyl esterase